MTVAVVCAMAAGAGAQEPRNAFQVKYVIEGGLYIDGGRNDGLTPGMVLSVRRPSPKNRPPAAGVVGDEEMAQIKVMSVTATSAACEYIQLGPEVRRGDIAYLSEQDLLAMMRSRSAGAKRQYPQVITFEADEDPIEDEQRAAVPRPPSPEVNRARGRIGIDHTAMLGRKGSTLRNSQTGLLLRADISRIGGSYWNLSGYWRGRWNLRNNPGQETLTDLINRTYHLALRYENPNSRWVAGVGRLYLPWATSLDTLDGGYFGMRLGKKVTTGIFAGSTPDPTSWNYDPNRQIAGTFVNVETGGFDRARYTGTFGVALSSLNWRLERPFVFLENGLFYKSYISLYNSVQADQPRLDPALGLPQAKPGVSRSYTTFRVQPHHRLAFDLNHNYFRDLPTFDPRLVSTGLVDKLLFEGYSGGVRVQLPLRLAVYTTLGRSDRTGDQRPSWNRMYGVTLTRLPWVGIRADARYSEFDNSFGQGTYRSFSLMREFKDAMRIEVQAGEQDFLSPLTTDTGSRFVNATFDTAIGRNYFLTGGFTAHRGDTQSYDQWFTTFGYRFDTRGRQ